MRTATTSFKAAVNFLFEGIAASPAVFPGIDYSDHWSYWQLGVPAIMITDTAMNRNRCYHKACDVSRRKEGAERLKYESLARVVVGIQQMIEDLADPNKWP